VEVKYGMVSAVGAVRGAVLLVEDLLSLEVICCYVMRECCS
jgi:hypothetical protein